MKKAWDFSVKSLAVAAVLGTALSFGAAPVPQASASIGGAVLGAVQGGVVYAQIDKELKYYNNTEEGRQKLLAQYKKKLGVNEDAFLNGQLEDMMAEMTRGIRAVDPSIDKKPYVYFINNETSFNAFCSKRAPPSDRQRSPCGLMARTRSRRSGESAATARS